MTISVAVVDDQPLVRAGIAMLLGAEHDISVVAEISDGSEVVTALRGVDVDVVVMDIRMPGMDGVTATRLLTDDTARPDRLTKVLVVTTFDDDEAVYGALQAGASGFVLKQAAPKELVTAVRKVAGGEAWIDPAIAGKVIAAFAGMPRPAVASGEVLRLLTAREREVLVLMSEGLSNSDITKRLVLSEATVKTHVSRILMKTGAHDRAQAVVLAYQSGLVRPRRG